MEFMPQEKYGQIESRWKGVKVKLKRVKVISIILKTSFVANGTTASLSSFW